MDTVYLQTYSLGRDFFNDFKGNLKKVKDIGYAGVEFAGGYGGYSPADLKAYMEEINLIPFSSHVGYDQLEQNIEYLHDLGAKYMICPGAPFTDRKSCEVVAKEFNRIGRLCRDAGLVFGYHNHMREFIKDGGETLEEIMMDLTDPDLVQFQIDVGWATSASVDVPAFMARHAGRICLVHVKETDRKFAPDVMPDWSKLPKDAEGHTIVSDEIKKTMKELQECNCPTGKGIIDWSVIKKAADAAGCKGYVVEREYDYKHGDIYGCVAEDLAALKDI